jgi:hypothetical protein
VSTECYVRGAHLQCVDAVVIRKIASAEDDRLGTNVRFASSDMDAIDREEVLRGPPVKIVPILIRYRVSFSTALVPQLQLCHLHWLVSVSNMLSLTP